MEHGHMVKAIADARETPESEAVTEAIACPPAPVLAAATAKSALVERARMVTAAGTIKPGLSLERASVAPLSGAAPEMATVQEPVSPAFKEPGLHVTKEGRYGFTLNVAVAVDVSRSAPSVTFWLVETLPAVAVNVAELAPTAMASELGTLTRELLEVRRTERSK